MNAQLTRKGGEDASGRRHQVVRAPFARMLATAISARIALPARKTRSVSRSAVRPVASLAKVRTVDLGVLLVAALGGSRSAFCC
jgi:hypothetical protein